MQLLNSINKLQINFVFYVTCHFEVSLRLFILFYILFLFILFYITFYLKIVFYLNLYCIRA